MGGALNARGPFLVYVGGEVVMAGLKRILARMCGILTIISGIPAWTAQSRPVVTLSLSIWVAMVVVLMVSINHFTGGNELLCWFIAAAYARRKCLLVEVKDEEYRNGIGIQVFERPVSYAVLLQAFVGIMDDYFEGYYTEEMIESQSQKLLICHQVDQLVFEELMRERFPKLVNHLDYLGVQVTWISGPWFLSIFVNMIPWESVLRVWDVLLFEGNRVMLFRTALALMELYGPSLVTTKDAGDAITLLQSLVGSTFDSSQLVFTACMGYLAVTEARLQELREKHRPSVLDVIEERSKKGRAWKDSKGLSSKLYSFKHDPGSVVEERKITEGGDVVAGEDVQSESHSSNLDELLNSLNVDSEVDSLPDLQEQVASPPQHLPSSSIVKNNGYFVNLSQVVKGVCTVYNVDWLKVELCRLLEEKRSAILRAEELETAFMEMVKEDNRLQLTARVEQLEQEVAELQQALADKKEQEAAMLQVLMRLEQDQKSTEDARRRAEQELAAQKYEVHVLQEKYEKAMTSIADMEKRVVMAESMLEATLQYESGQSKALSSPRAGRVQSPRLENSTRKIGLLSFGLGWRDKNKGKSNAEESSESLHDNVTPREESNDQEQDR
ncbi:Rab-GTPase-TBC domain [Sesbania bispinosa]|nr:Rab-GTPase-TBC domain [Sesbania bispinosa]